MLFKTVAALVGLPLTLGGFIGFWYGVYVALAERSIGTGVGISLISIVALTAGTLLGAYARGDYD